MGATEERGEAGDMLDVRRAAELVGRHPETIRRWVWSGRLAARRRGTRLLLARADVEAVAASHGEARDSLAAWADRAQAARKAAGVKGSGRTAADLVIEDRGQRSRPADGRARR